MSSSKTTGSIPLWRRIVRDRSLNATERIVLLYLWDRQGDNGDAWPTQRTIAHDLGLSERQVRRVTESLAGKSWLKITWPEGPGRNHSKHYIVVPPEKRTPVSSFRPFKMTKSGHQCPVKSGHQCPVPYRKNTPIRTHPTTVVSAGAETPPGGGRSFGPKAPSRGLFQTDDSSPPEPPARDQTADRVRQVFDRWNVHAGRQVEKPGDNGKPEEIRWHSHTLDKGKVRPAINDAVRRRLKDGYSVEDIGAAIDNFARVLLEPEYRWSYVWTLDQFLTRHQHGDVKGPLQLALFVPDGFEPDKFLTANAVSRIPGSVRVNRVFSRKCSLRSWSASAPVD